MADFIRSQKAQHPDLASEYEVFLELYDQKLWHQLSVALEGFLMIKANKRGNSFAELYFQFISKFEARLSPLRLAKLVSMIAYSSFAPAEAVGFLTSVLRARERLGTEASLCLDIDVTHMKLLVGERQEVKHYIEDHRDEIQKGSYGEATVCSKFFRLTMEYHKIVGTAQEFYRAALTYLSYTPIEELTVEERFSLATDMAIAAVVGDAVYNLGEVIATPILTYLKATDNEWLLNLVLALNDGDIDRFNSIVDPTSSPYFTQAAFARDHELVKQKLVLIALMNLVFDTPAHERTITYTAIAERVRMPVEQVDWILMKALSLGLIKGKIDEVAQTINVSWVQSRVMSIAQAKAMEDNVNAWVAKVKTCHTTVQDQAVDLFA